MAIEIVDLPNEHGDNMVIFQSYANVYQKVIGDTYRCWSKKSDDQLCGLITAKLVAYDLSHWERGFTLWFHQAWLAGASLNWMEVLIGKSLINWSLFQQAMFDDTGGYAGNFHLKISIDRQFPFALMTFHGLFAPSSWQTFSITTQNAGGVAVWQEDLITIWCRSAKTSENLQVSSTKKINRMIRPQVSGIWNLFFLVTKPLS